MNFRRPRCAAVSGVAFFVFLAAGLFLGPGRVEAADGPRLTRGPYLQLPTTSNIVVRWRTDIPTPSRVRFGLSPDNLAWSCADSAVVADHALTLTNLAPATRYYYAVGAGTGPADLAGGADCYFQTAPATSAPTRIWVLGDAGTTYNQPLDLYYGLGLIVEGQRAVRDAYYNFAGPRHTDVWLLLGDNAYNDGVDGDYTSNFFNIYPEMTRRAAAWSTIGNHEVVPGTGDAAAYLDIFTLPTRGEAGGVPSGNERYYTFDHGHIHFICLDSEVSSRDPGSAQLTWLQADLEANTNEWLIVFWHSPPYSKGSHDSDFRSALIKMRENVVPILERYGVDLVLCGHSHVYERSFLIDGHYGNTASWRPTMAKDAGSGRPGDTGAYLKASAGPRANEGAVYVVAGSSGWAWNAYGLNHPAMFIGMSKLGSLVIDVEGRRLDARFLRETGEVGDSFAILKGAPAKPVQFATFKLAGNRVTARWKSVAGRAYQIESTPTLAALAWMPISPRIVATGATTSWTGPATPGINQEYYRVSTVE